jgi:uncharacterized protein (DUF111 family)
MRIAYFDCGYGAAGDMLLGALISAGLPVEAWLRELDKIALPPDSFKIELSDVMRCSLAAKKVDVHYKEFLSDHWRSDGDAHSHEPAHEHSHEHSLEPSLEPSHEPSHEHEHTRDGEHYHAHTDSHSHSHAHGESTEHNHSHDYNRNLPEVLRIIAASQIKPRAKELASKIFTTLGEAEAKVHGTTID